MVDLTGLHKHFILEHLKEGEVAVDFTMGNGNDTLFLSKTVGTEGRVYAFDIQEDALTSTRAHLKENARNAPCGKLSVKCRKQCAPHRIFAVFGQNVNAVQFALGRQHGTKQVADGSTVKKCDERKIMRCLKMRCDHAIAPCIGKNRPLCLGKEGNIRIGRRAHGKRIRAF